MTRDTRIGFITYSDLPTLTDDDRLLALELRRRGYHVQPIAWDAGQPPDLDAFVMRSPWDYHLRASAFAEWIHRCSMQGAVYNDPQLLRWNMHKSYLHELAAADVATVPTVLCRNFRRYDLAGILNQRGWERAVVKPAVSASSYMTARVSLRTSDVDTEWKNASIEGQHFLESVLDRGDALVQPFLESIYTARERSLIYFDGIFSHAIVKDAFTRGIVEVLKVEASTNERDLAQRALSVLPEVPLYARIDLIPGHGGQLQVMELELIDPELYFRCSEGASAMFADALEKRIP